MIKYFSIRTGETRDADTEPKIAALYNSSDLGVNARQGQDFGWRLAPEIVIQMRRIKEDYPKLMQIAQQFSKNVDELNDPDILHYISLQTSPEAAPIARQDDYQDVYDQEVRRQLQESETPTQTEDTATTTTTTEKKDTTTTSTTKVK